MSANLNACQLSPASGNVLTCKGRLAYADGVYKKKLPEGEKDPEKARFQVSILFPKGSDLAILNDLVEKAAAERFGPDYKTKHRVKKPFLKTEDFPKIGLKPEEFPVFIRANSPSKPQVVRADKSTVDAEKLAEEAYSGRWARISVRAYTYDHPQGGKGVSLGLQNVQLLDHDEPIGGMRPSADDEFEPIADVAGKEGGGNTDALFS